MHGKVLKDAELDYRDLRQFGRITIELSGNDVFVTVDGFVFGERTTGRQHVAKAIAWARDVLAAKLEADRLVPGGSIVSVSGMWHEDFERAHSVREEAK